MYHLCVPLLFGRSKSLHFHVRFCVRVTFELIFAVVSSYRTRGAREGWHGSSSYRGMWQRNRNARLETIGANACTSKVFFKPIGRRGPLLPDFTNY